MALLIDWVKKGVAPGKSIAVTGGGRSLPMYSDVPHVGKRIDGCDRVERSRRSGRASRCGMALLDAIRHDALGYLVKGLP